MREPLLFFNEAAAETIEAATARIFPSDELGAGAIEARAVIYIDRALAGPYASLADLYRRAIAALDTVSQARYGARFAALPPERQDAVLHAMEQGELAEQGVPAAFMPLLVRHTREGMFCDPAHGGNRDLVGWRLLGYPGIHRVWHHDEQAIGAPIRPRPLTTVADDRFGIDVHDEARGQG
ncbi:MAG: gluconate 2-dehydrogenase gamma chain [Thermomicrobiales bacterium]|nr:gluconate 2-dehydrogenase gamma chain [Thermomicrobiales bacterium]